MNPRGQASRLIYRGSKEEQQGDTVQTEHHQRKAIKLEPNSFGAYLKLGQMLHNRGDAVRAAPHLRKATESHNPRIRDAANQLLTAK